MDITCCDMPGPGRAREDNIEVIRRSAGKTSRSIKKPAGAIAPQVTWPITFRPASDERRLSSCQYGASMFPAAGRGGSSSRRFHFTFSLSSFFSSYIYTSRTFATF